MKYKSLSRKYRPKTFIEVVGQEYFIKALNYAIKNNKISNCFLLNGIRGIGKTTIARIIAHVVNCTSRVIEADIVVPCNNCINCKNFNNNSHPDILEIDAASNTSVEDTREIILQSNYVPSIAQYKIFIIDEVHMLSKSAFNSLLKTLEEPPENVIFILATTEIHKVPVTIISRCQKFDLKPLSASQIFDLLKQICVKENIGYQDSSINEIVYKSEGSARDAISLLEQAGLISNGNISDEVVHSMFGANCIYVAIDLLHSISESNTEKAINILKEFYAVNADLLFLVENLLEVIAYLSKLITINNYESSIFNKYKLQLQEISGNFTLDKLTLMWQIAQKGVNEINYSFNKFVALEMLVIKLIFACSIPSPIEIIEEQKKKLI